MGSSVELAAVLTPSVIEEIDCGETNTPIFHKGKLRFSNIITLVSDMQP